MKLSCFARNMWKGITLLFLMCVIAIGLYSFFEPQQKNNLKKEPLSKQEILANFLNIPIHFEKNAGQIDASIQYTARCPGHTFYFGQQEVSMLVQGNQNALSSLSFQFVGSNPQTIINGINEQAGKANYFIGKDPAKWRANISTYTQISYRDIYPGIDAIFYGNGKQLEYDFCVAPGKDPSKVRLQVAGAKELTIDQNGDLNIAIEEGQSVQMKKPLIYQMVDGRKVDILGEFVLLAKNEIGFSLSDYDASNALVIDPILSYSTYLGGNNADPAFDIVVDESGNAYVIGTTSSTNFPTTPGAYKTVLPGALDVFVTKLNSSGSGLLYSTYIGGSSVDLGSSIAIDFSGNAYITGSTLSANFPTTPGAFQSILKGSQNAFLTKLNSTGSALLYSTYLGGGKSDNGASIVIDDNGNAYITGFTNSLNFPVTPGAFQTSLLGTFNAFIAKLNSTGTNLIYATYFGGNNDTTATSIVIDNEENAYIAGGTTSTNLVVSSDAVQSTKKGGQDAFIASFNSIGTALRFSTYLGGGGDDQAFGIDIDAVHNIYISGITSSSDFPVTSGAFQTTFGGTSDAFVTKLNAEGSALVYSTYLGGSLLDNARAIKIDSNRNAYITGFTSSTNFPVTSNAFQPHLTGGQNAFLTKLNSDGSALIYSTYLGGSSTDYSFAIALDISGNAYIAGAAFSTNFPVTPGAFQTTYGGGLDDAFIAKFILGTPAVTSISPNVGPATGGTTVTITGTNFTNTTAVFFGPIAAASFVINSDTQITAISPPYVAGTVDITVQAAGDVSAISSDDQFTYQLVPTTAKLTVAPNPVKLDQPVTLTVTITPSAATGTVSFYSNNKLLGIARVANGQGILITSFAQAGKQLIVAAYSGDNQFSGSTTPVVTLQVGKAKVPQPRKLTGFQKIHGFQTTNILKWEAPKNSKSIVAYRVYRGDLRHQIGTVTNLENLRFKDTKVKVNKKYVYFVASVDEFGNISKPVKVVIKGFAK